MARQDTASTFDHVSHSAPEYVDVILWHRVALAAAALLLILGGAGYGLFQWLQDPQPAPVDALGVNLQLETAAPAAIPDATPAESSSKTITIAAPLPAIDSAAKSTAATPPRLARTSPADSRPDLPDQSGAAEKLPAKTGTPATTASNRQHGVQTRILMPAVKRAIITETIKGREPGEPVSDTRPLSQRDAFTLHLFIDVQGRAGDTFTYQWKQNGKVRTTVRIPVRTNTWRGYASKEFQRKKDLAGDWQVTVVDKRGILLARSKFHLDG